MGAHHRRGGIKASELIQRLSTGDLDAVIYPGGAGGNWFNWVIEGGASRTPDPRRPRADGGEQIKPLFSGRDVESHLAWFNKERIYPTYHFLGIRKSVAASHPGLTDALVDAFERAAVAAPSAYMSGEERKLYEREKELLGLDPNQCGLNAVHKKTIERCLDYLEADRFLPRRPTLREIFPLSVS